MMFIIIAKKKSKYHPWQGICWGIDGLLYVFWNICLTGGALFANVKTCCVCPFADKVKDGTCTGACYKQIGVPQNSCDPTTPKLG